MNLPWGTGGSNDVKKHFDTPNHKNNKKKLLQESSCTLSPSGQDNVQIRIMRTLEQRSYC